MRLPPHNPLYHSLKKRIYIRRVPFHNQTVTYITFNVETEIMNLNLIPNIESYQKYIDYFEQTANTPASASDYILIGGDIPIQEKLTKHQKPAPETVQLIDPPPEVQTERAKEELKRGKKRASTVPHQGAPASSADHQQHSDPPRTTYDKPKKQRCGKVTKKNSLVFSDIFSKRR